MPDLTSMVHNLVRKGYIQSARVKEAMLAVDRALFNPFNKRSSYYDEPIPIYAEQTISAPHMVAIMLELAEIEENSKILEIGTGSGYNACLLAHLSKKGVVVSVENIEVLYELAKKNLQALPCSKNIKLISGDGSKGYSPAAPYDRILVTCGAPEVPKPIWDQLSENGKLIIPIGGRYYQILYLIEKKKSKMIKNYHGEVAFVPLIGEFGFKKEYD